jgi:colanic acid/amylovoran biosynthesis protein
MAEPRSRPTQVLILWADDNSPNLGVRVLARGTADLARSVWPDAQVTFHNYGSRRRELPIGRLRSLFFERLTGRRGMLEWFRRFDVVIDTRSGDSFTDGYGMHRHAVMTAVGVFAAQAGVPVALGPQTIGPFGSALGRALARATLRSATVVLARDSVSATVAANLGFPLRPSTTDVVFSLAPPPTASRERDVILNVSGLLWNENPHVDSGQYRSVVEHLARELLAGGRQLTLLAHVVHSENEDSDIEATRELAERLDGEPGSTVEVVVPTDLDDARSILASARVVIGSRMHACLNALSVGVPALPLAYSDKFAPLLADLGWNHSIDLRTDPQPVLSALNELATLARADVAAVRAEAEISRHGSELALAGLRLSRVAV